MLVARYSALAHRTAVLLGAGADAEDVVQDSFVAAFSGLHRFRPGAPFRPWLLRIVVNRMKNLHRGRSRRLVLELRAGAERPDTIVDPEQLALDRLQRDALLEAVRSLADKDQLVVTCRFFLDLSEDETARVLGWPRGSVKSRTSRALARLRARLGPTPAVSRTAGKPAGKSAGKPAGESAGRSAGASAGEEVTGG
ncbi:MAG TPA: sigma-70 family RNA polymerase sigma factor [Pseudonocardiaceae bacterium]|nr:sigma-70 family RNA polymerase sigma factor [Pseudonocardiaceae bacterium]